MEKSKKFLSVLLTFAIILSAFGQFVFAAESPDGKIDSSKIAVLAETSYNGDLGQYVGANLFDGNKSESNRWCCKFSEAGNNPYVVFKLPKKAILSRMIYNIHKKNEGCRAYGLMVLKNEAEYNALEESAKSGYLSNKANWKDIVTVDNFSKELTAVETLITTDIETDIYRFDVTEGQDESNEWANATELELFCQTEKNITLTFNPGEGTGTAFTQIVKQNSTGVLPKCEFTPPEDKIFTGWQASDGTVKAAGTSFDYSGITENSFTWTALYRNKYEKVSGITVLGCSGETNENEIAEYAFDGDIDTKWCVNKDGDIGWLAFSLAEPASLNKMIVEHAEGHGNDGKLNNTIEFSLQAPKDEVNFPKNPTESFLADDANWVDIVKVNNSEQNKQTVNTFTADSYQYYRINVTDGDSQDQWNAVRIYEVELYKGIYLLNPVKISFAAGDGSGTMKTVTIEKDTLYTLPECEFTVPAGLKFEGWKINGGTVIHKVGESVVITEDTVLTACFKSGNIIQADDIQWTTDTWVANGSIILNNRVEIKGNVILCLKNNCVLDAAKGIRVTEGNSLTIISENSNTGKLTVNTDNADNAGIGANAGENCGTITVNGGNIITQGNVGIGGCTGGKAEFSFSTGENGKAYINTYDITDKSAEAGWQGIIILRKDKKGIVNGNQKQQYDINEPDLTNFTVKANSVCDLNGKSLTIGGTVTNNGDINFPQGSNINVFAIDNSNHIHFDLQEQYDAIKNKINGGAVTCGDMKYGGDITHTGIDFNESAPAVKTSYKAGTGYLTYVPADSENTQIQIILDNAQMTLEEGNCLTAPDAEVKIISIGNNSLKTNKGRGILNHGKHVLEFSGDNLSITAAYSSCIDAQHITITDGNYDLYAKSTSYGVCDLAIGCDYITVNGGNINIKADYHGIYVDVNLTLNNNAVMNIECPDNRVSIYTNSGNMTLNDNSRIIANRRTNFKSYNIICQDQTYLLENVGTYTYARGTISAEIIPASAESVELCGFSNIIGNLSANRNYYKTLYDDIVKDYIIIPEVLKENLPVYENEILATKDDIYAGVESNGVMWKYINCTTKIEKLGAEVNEISGFGTYKITLTNDYNHISFEKTVLKNSDINADGNVNILDMVKMKKMLVKGTEPLPSNGLDVNNNGVFDAEDLIFINKKLLGII